VVKKTFLPYKWKSNDDLHFYFGTQILSIKNSSFLHLNAFFFQYRNYTENMTLISANHKPSFDFLPIMFVYELF